MAIFVTIPAATDDDGSGTTGTPITNSWLQTVLKAAIDAALASQTIVTPATITADQNNYNPTGLSTAQVLRLSSDASRTITGIAAQIGRRLILTNGGVNNILLAHQNGSSTAANRINTMGGVTITLGVTENIELYYDDVSGCWRTILQA